MKKVQLPISNDFAKSLKIGDVLLLNGKMLVARDEAHLLLKKTYDNNQPLPCSFNEECIFYMGPATDKEGIITSAGPTTSARMDAFLPFTLDIGVKCYIGKGKRSGKAIDQMKESSALYLSAIGGAGALYASCIKKAKIIAFEHLGAEALREIEVEDFPVIVALDLNGGYIYE